MKKKVLVSVMSLTLITGLMTACGGGVSQSDYDNLKAERDTLESEYEVSKTNCDSLQADYDALQADYDAIKAEYESYKEEMKPFEEMTAAEAEARKVAAEEEQKKIEEEKAAKAKEEEEAKKKAEEEEKKAAEEKAKKGYDTGITYDQLARNPEDYKGEKVKFKGKVVQLIEDSSSDEIQIRFAVDKDYDTILYCGYDKSIVSSRVLEDDVITIYGTSVGTISYESTLGGTITIPAVYIDKIDQ